MVRLVQYRAETVPNEPAFIYLANGVDEEIVMSNAELDRSARRIAAWLQSRNLFGGRALLLYPPGLDFITAYLGCLYAGVIAIPVYPPRRNRSILRIETVAKNAEAAIALTTEDVIKTVGGMLDEAPSLKHIDWVATTNLDENLADSWAFPDIDSDTIAFLQYTSGSTGAPKGVILTHGNLLHNSEMISQGFEHTRTGRGVFWLPSYHDMGLIGGIVQPLYCGRPNIIMSPLSFLQKPFRWLAAITRYKATTSGGPNFAYDLCVRNIPEAQLDELNLSSWTVAFNGAEPVLAETMEAFAQKFERCGFRYEAFYPCFGLAEGTLIVSGGYVKNRPVIRSLDPKELSIGRAVEVRDTRSKSVRYVSSGQKLMPDERIAIVDPETCVECPDSIVGEIWVKSPSNAKGYWNAPEATERTFHAKIARNVVGEGGESPFMRTGDLGFVMDGELFVTGRIKDLIIVRGVNVYPQDIEMTVQKTSPHLRPLGGAAFMVRDDSELPQEHLVIVQELERQFKGDTEQIFTDIKKAVALEHEIPVLGIVLIKSGSIPKTSSGKIQHHSCRNGFLDGSLNEVARWVSGDVSFWFVQGGEAENALEEAVGLTDSDDHSKIVRGTVPFAVGAPHKPIPPDPIPDQPIHKLIKETPAKEPAQPAISLISKEEIAAIVLEEVRKIAKERATHLTLETDITELGLDSLERMEILASLEDRFGGQFPESILPELFTAQQVLDAVLIYLGTGPRKTLDLNKNRSRSEIPDEDYRIEKFPEYLRLKAGLDLIQGTGLNRFFDVHEGITNDRATIGGKEYINFSNYNYVNTSGDPEVTKAAIEACEKYGTSVSASRLVSGNKPIHRELENEISRFLGCEDTIVFVGGHSTNEGVIGHLLNEKDMILADALAHNSIVEGALLSGARRRPFPHNDWEAVDWILNKHRGEYRRVMIAVEGVYSMDGDYPDLPKLIEVKKRHAAMLLVDEAHSMGVLGATGRGIGEHFDVDRRDVDLWMSTLSKTFASCGGYISGSKELVEFLKYTSPNFVFSVGISPANCAAALAALRVLDREPQRVEQLRQNSKLFLELAKEHGFNTGMSNGTAVVPIILGNSMLSLHMSKALFERGVNVQPILHPAVEEKAARLRFFITSAHTEEQIRYTVNALADSMKQTETPS
ncbi:MAG: aminotransferase class I/II-fold pyridoxal phosphate-dependent enzyme [Planctomycetaceae bacterium]|nr:aminotransferase class I/II-fold pyridoxal phosphate-dependent enzyme [Planctomycetaceae bacterium]